MIKKDAIILLILLCPIVFFAQKEITPQQFGAISGDLALQFPAKSSERGQAQR